MKELPKPILQALKRSKLSQALSTDFSQFLNQHPDWKLQTLYLLNDKNQKIEQVIQELLGVPIHKQSTWAKEPIKKTELDLQSVNLNLKNYTQYNAHIRQTFKDWKQENGFFSSFLEFRNTYVFIRIQPFLDENFKQQFSWFFNKAKYSKEGWRIEKNIKNITSRLIDSKYSPGENVKTYLESNFLLMDKKAKSPIEPSCQPNTFSNIL